MQRISSRAAMTAMALLSVAVLACGDPAAPPVTPAVASVIVSPSSHALVVGSQLPLNVLLKSADGDLLQRPVTWTSETETVATVSPTGVVTALGPGEAVIRATSETRFGRAVITVTPPPPVPVAEVRLSADTQVVIPWNGQAQITATALDADGNVLPGRAVAWQSNRTNIATVADGRITAVNPGLATITATIEGKVSSVGVRVNPPAITSLRIMATTTGLEVQDLMLFAAEVTRANGEVMYEPVEWSSNRPDVVRVENVDLTGATLGALAEGEATITIAKEGARTSMTVKVSPRPAHDLIYSRWADTESRVMHLSLLADGLAPVALNAGAVSRDPSPSPDGSRFVFAVSQSGALGEMQNDLYVVNRNGLSMRRLTSLPGLEDSPQWSPDGTKILFRAIVDGASDIYVIDVDGTNLVNVTAGAPADLTNRSEPAWSPDGTRIAFIGVRNGQHKVWTIGVGGGDLRQVTADAGFDQSPAFSPDGQRIAFTRYNAANAQLGDDIMIVAASGGTPTRLALPGDQRMPAWSPDGSLIAVSGTATTGEARAYIYTLRPDGTGLRLRTVNPAWYGAVSPAWIKR